jgi:hypothetical protein
MESPPLRVIPAQAGIQESRVGAGGGAVTLDARFRGHDGFGSMPVSLM